jgi:hypothetical protein
MQKQAYPLREKVVVLYLDDKTKWTYLKQGDILSIISDKGKKYKIPIYKILKWSEKDYLNAKKRISISIELQQVKDYVSSNLWGIPQDDDYDQAY